MMQRSLKVGFCMWLHCVLLAGVAHAGGLDQFKAFISTTHAAKGNFTQRQIKLVKGVEKLASESSGTFMFARPGQFIWSYQQPYEQLLQADGENFYMYDKDLNQVTIKALGTALSSSPAAILFGNNDLEKNFTLQEVGNKEGLAFFQATPKDKESTFALIKIGMQEGIPRKMELRDNFNQTTVILLQNMEKNPALLEKNKPNQFKFIIPTGADVYRS